MNEDPGRWESFRARLDQGHDWPCEYVFKVIVPAAEVDRALAVLDRPEHTRRSSRSGKYVSVTITMEMAGVDDVVAAYREWSKIEGAVLL